MYIGFELPYFTFSKKCAWIRMRQILNESFFSFNTNGFRQKGQFIEVFIGFFLRACAA